MPVCGDCGTEHDAGEATCPSCGVALTAASDSTRAGDDADELAPSASDGSSDDAGTGISRRLVLGSVVVAAGGVLGAAGDAPTHRLDAEAWNVRREAGERSVRLFGTVALPVGRYGAWSLRPRQVADYDVNFEVTAGGPVDVFVMRRLDYDAYSRGRGYIRYDDALTTTQSTGATLSGRLTPGEYRFVVDNTAAYGARPEGDVVVAVELTASV